MRKALAVPAGVLATVAAGVQVLDYLEVERREAAEFARSTASDHGLAIAATATPLLVAGLLVLRSRHRRPIVPQPPQGTQPVARRTTTRERRLHGVFVSRTVEVIEEFATPTVTLLIMLGVCGGILLAYRESPFGGDPGSSPTEQLNAPTFQAADPPSIALSTASGPPGTRLTIGGRGFAPGETVVIRFHTEELARVQTDEQGAFSDVRVMVPGDWAFVGQFNWIATGLASMRRAHAPFEVTGLSGTPDGSPLASPAR
jgi:hypothetical protein